MDHFGPVHLSGVHIATDYINFRSMLEFLLSTHEIALEYCAIQ